MQAPVDFSEISVETPTLEQAVADYAGAVSALDAAKTADDRARAVRRWDELRRRLNTWKSLVNLRFNQDAKDEAYKAARDYCDELTPKLVALEVDVKRRLLGSSHRRELERLLGRHAFALWEADVSAFDPAIEAELVAELKLIGDYTELIASAKLEFDGKVHNLAGLAPYMEHKDRDVRHRAELARWQFFSDNRAALDRIYDELVRLRHAMALKLGFNNFIGLGYRRMRRIDYAQADVERYRDQVAKEVVPVAGEILRRRASKLGVDKLKFWDESIADPAGNPVPLGDHDWILERGREAFGAMAPALGEFYGIMVGKHLLDLKNRPTKAGGGFCTNFPSYGVPYVFTNFNGTSDDVRVFVHELGHAFQSWQSRGQKIVDYLTPTSESAEINSMGLEFLSFPQMERFFGQDADRFRADRVADAFLFLPYGVAVDHFQHLVYAKPEATPEERHRMWQQVEARYLPWRDYGDLAHPAMGGLWQEKRHLYRYPFYYIDYTLALCCALQFWVRAERDYRAALADYIELCKRGGEAPFGELARSANLVSPFEDGVLTRVVQKARQVLALA